MFPENRGCGRAIPAVSAYNMRPHQNRLPGGDISALWKKRAGILTMRFSFPQAMVLKTGDVFHE